MIDNLFLRLGIIYALILTGVVFKWLIKEVDSLIKNISFLLSNLLMPVAVFTSIIQFSEAFNDFRIPLFSVSIFFLSFIAPRWHRSCLPFPRRNCYVRSAHPPRHAPQNRLGRSRLLDGRRFSGNGPVQIAQ